MPAPEKSAQSPSGPAQVLSLGDATAIIVGLIIGAGIFGTPSIVAGAVESPALLVAVWVAGGAFSVIGALCYAELATAFPSAGGEYHFIGRAYGRPLAFLYGWARMTVVVAGSIAVFAYLFGDYMSRVIHLGPQSSAIWAVLVVTVLTAVNYAGIREGKLTQNFFTFLECGGLVLIIVAGFALALVVFGAFQNAGFKGLVEYSLPVFWGFFMLTGIALFILRVKERNAPRPFRVPGYPAVPGIFVLTCAYLLYSSLAYHRTHALVGLVVLAVGAAIMLFGNRGQTTVCGPKTP